jgi:hypothetical protein
MRTTLTLDDDVAALIEVERRRTGESMRQVVNRLLRRAARGEPSARGVVELPRVAGKPHVDLSDTSALIAELDDADALEARLQ